MNEESLFHLALQQSDAVARAAFLDQACANQPEIRARLEKLVQAHEAPVDLFDKPAIEIDATIDDPICERPGAVIGPYKLMEQIGEGGMGLVFIAEQQQPVRRKVALKVIKPGMDTRQVVARFEAERQALALMDHPNIAKVLDGGQTSSGLPYFVMELVNGKPITEYCDQNQLPIRERLELFIPVCQAVQHAHQKGIIHRDLKPSNVLVISHDGTPVVKVIDFGVAKAIGQQLTDKTIYTQISQMVGTPLYMSPEQAGHSCLDVDTRSDIYSLGVLLYELLTGTTPFDRQRLHEADYDEIRCIIREEEPPRPSTRISTLGQAATTVSTNRRSDARQLSRLFRGELDWIVMKALEKDRNRRYDTASAFAADVQHYLQDEPVHACPPSAWYRLGKFTRRNKTRLVLAACGVALVLGLAGSVVWSAQQKTVRLAETERTVTRALDQAEVLLDEGDKQIDHPERWQATARLALAAVEKAEELLAAGVATEELAAQVRQARQAVDAAVRDSRLLVQLDNIRLEQAAVDVGGNRFDEARVAPLYAKALAKYGIDLSAPEAGAAQVRVSRLREALLSVLAEWAWFTPDDKERQQVERVYDLAVPLGSLWAELAAAMRRRDRNELVRLAQEPSIQDLPRKRISLAAKNLAALKEWAAAEQLLRAGLERKPGDFWLNQELGLLLLDQQPSRPEEAVRYLTAAVALRPDSPGAHLNLGIALRRKGDVAGALQHYRAALRINTNYGAAHVGLGSVHMFKGELDEAITEYRMALRINKDDADAHGGLGTALHKKGWLDEAIAEYREAHRIKPDRADFHNNLGYALAAKGRFDKAMMDEAIAHYREAIRLRSDFAEAYNNLGIALAAKGLLDEAIAEYHKALGLNKDYANAHHNLGVALSQKGRLDEAIPEYQEAIRINKDFAEAHCNLGLALYLRGRFREAVKELRLGRELASRNPRMRPPPEQLLRDAERFADLDSHLPALLQGREQPKDAEDRLALAQLCHQYKQRFAAAVRWYSEAFAALPPLADDLSARHRYNAACAAALAGCGQGADADKLDSQERGRLRHQALDWLRADLNAYRHMLEKSQGKAGLTIAEQMQHWLQDSDFAGVRGAGALARLPKAERSEWEKLWQEVQALRQRAAERPSAASSARP